MEGGAFSWITGQGRQPKQAEIGSQWQTSLRSWCLFGRELCLLLQPFGQSAHPLLNMSCFPAGLRGAGRGFRGTKSPSKDCCGSLCCAAPPHLPVQGGMQKFLAGLLKCGGGRTGVDLNSLDLFCYVCWSTSVPNRRTLSWKAAALRKKRLVFAAKTFPTFYLELKAWGA